MDPLTLGISAAAQILRLVDWRKVAESLATDGVRDGAKGLLKRLKPAGRDEAARQAIALFIEEFHRELEDKLPLTAALPAYDDQIKRLVESAAPDIAAWMQPETKDVDLAPVERMWNGLGLDPLPENFDWPLVGQADYAALITTMCSISLRRLNLLLCKVRPWHVRFLTGYGRQKGSSMRPKDVRLDPNVVGYAPRGWASLFARAMPAARGHGGVSRPDSATPSRPRGAHG